MILGVTDPEYEYTELKIFLEECDEYAFKEMINNQDYAELIKYIRSYVDNYSRVNYRALCSELLHLLTLVSIEQANNFFTCFTQSVLCVAPLFEKLKLDKLDAKEMCLLYNCSVKELTVNHDNFFGLRVRAECCDIEVLNIRGGNVEEQDFEESFPACNIVKLNLFRRYKIWI